MPAIASRQIQQKSMPAKPAILAGNLARGAYAWRFMRPAKRFGAIVFLLSCCVLIGAEPARLPADQMEKAIRLDAISIPTPGELFAALEKRGKPNWVGQMRGPIGTNYKNRAQIALNLGGLIADG